MIGKIIFISVLAATSPALAQAPVTGAYHVRNETSRSFTCGLRREPQRRIHRFLLRRGSDYRHEARGGAMRTLLCDTQRKTQRFPLRAGGHYALVERQGFVSLRRLPNTPSAP